MIQDLRYALRIIARTLGASAIVVLTLAFSEFAGLWVPLALASACSRPSRENPV